MTFHSCFGTGPEISKTEIEAIGRASLANQVILDLRAFGKDKDILDAWDWMKPRPGIDADTRAEVLATLFPKQRATRAMLPKLRHADPRRAFSAAACS